MYTVMRWDDELQGMVPVKSDTGKVLSYDSWSEAMDAAQALTLAGPPPPAPPYSVAFIRPRRKVKRP